MRNLYEEEILLAINFDTEHAPGVGGTGVGGTGVGGTGVGGTKSVKEIRTTMEKS